MTTRLRPPAASRLRRWLLIALAVVAVVAIAASVLSGFLVDLLWYREVGFDSVLWTIVRTRLLLGAGFGLVFFALLHGNLLVARRSEHQLPPPIEGQDELEQIRRAVEPHLRRAVPIATGVIAVLVGLSASQRWQTYLLWRNGSGLSFGTPEPLFDRDPAFYVFSLPWWQSIQGWLFGALLGVAFLTALAHLAWGGIQPAARGLADKLSPLAKTQLSVLAGLILFVQAWGYHLERYDLLTSPRGVVDGASYTDVRAQLPALNVLTLVAIISGLLFLVNLRLRRRNLALISVGLLLAVSIILGRAYPAFVQQFSVKPQEQEREAPYIEHNIEGTRLAFGLDKVVLTQRPVEPSASADDLADNQATVSNIRLWRPSIIRENFQSVQRIRQYYEFADVDVDRYDIDGQRRVLMIAGREVTQDGIPTGGKTWQNTHLVYTHGFGAVAAPVNTASSDGGPSLILQDLPPVGQPEIDQPRIYYGELSDVPFVLTNTEASELDYEGAAQTLEATYTGTGGIPLGGLMKRALFAWHYGDVNLLISGLIDGDSRILINRQLGERVPKAAPFLSFDDDPYLAVVGGRLLWIQDGYTSTDQYPYSQAIDLRTTADSSLGGRVNYLRNSVKVVVDAYTGELTYYLVDPEDPIADAWSRAFPDLFTPLSAAPDELLAHFRYPENLFQVQAAVFATYHVTDPEIFFQKQDVWQIPLDPTRSAGDPSAGGPLSPFYVQMRLPDSDEEHFQLVLPFTPEGRQNMTSWMAANSDPGSYGELTAYTFPTGRNIDGPTQVFARINQDPTFSTFRTLLGQEGSGILFGDLLTIPINDSIIYIVPVYVRSNQESSIPELKRVVVVNGDTVGVGISLEEALAASTEGLAAPTDDADESGTGTTGSVDDQVAELLQQALDRFEAADEALRSGDLATYQSELEAARRLVDRASGLG